MQHNPSKSSSRTSRTGRPPRACGQCRKSKLKCDRVHPICSRCLSHRLPCDAFKYPRDSEYIFRDQSDAIQRAIVAAKNSEHRLRSDQSVHSRSSVSRSPSASPLQDAMDFLLVNFVSSDDKMDLDSRFGDFTMFLGPMYLGEKNDSPLKLILHAIGLALYSRRSGKFGFMEKAVDQYLKATYCLRAAIKIPEIARKNATILAVLLFGMWETIKTNSERSGTWNAHIDGVAALIRNRGQSMLEDDESRRLLLNARNFFAIRNMMVYQENKRTRIVEDLGPEWFPLGPLDSPIGIFNSLTSIGMEIAKVRGTACPLMYMPLTVEVASNLAGLAQRVIEIDEHLSSWASSIPEAWSYHPVAMVPASGPSEILELFYPGAIDCYPTPGTENLWNRWRVYRMFAHMLIINCLERLGTSHYPEKSQILSSIKILQNMVNQVCSSVPYIMGYWQEYDHSWRVDDSSRLKKPSGDCTDREARHNFSSEKIDSEILPLSRWNILYTLTVSFEVVTVPQLQRDWIHSRRGILWTTHGLEQAEVLGRLSHDCLSRHPRQITLIDLAPPEGGVLCNLLNE